MKRYYTFELLYCFIALAAITVVSFICAETLQSEFMFFTFAASALIAFAVMIALVSEAMKEILNL